MNQPAKKTAALQKKALDPFRDCSRFLSPWLIGLSILGFGFLAYANSFHAAFHFDDYTNILNVKSIRQYGDIAQLWGEQKNRFIAYLTFAWNYRLGGFNSVSYHVVNWIIHLLSGLSVFMLLWVIAAKRDSKSGEEGGDANIWFAWIGTVIFLLHPLQTATVTYVVQRIAGLAGLFYTAAIMFYALNRKGILNSKKSYPFFSLCFLMALFSKENVVSLPAAICAFELCLVTDEDRRRSGSRPFFMILGISLFLILLFYVTAFAKGGGALVGGVVDLSRDSTTTMGRGQYFLTQWSVLTHYLRLSLWPVGQNADYDWPIAQGLLEARTLISGAALLSFLVSGFICLKRGAGAAAFFIFWFFITLSVESSFIPISDVIFEHRMYLPMVGIAGLFAIFLRQAVRRFGRPMLFLGVIALMLTVLTYRRNEVWRTEYSYQEDIIKKSPKKSRAYANLGKTYGDDGDIEKAIELFNKSLELSPQDLPARMNRGAAYQVKSMWQEALEDHLKVMELDPGKGVPLREAGYCYFKLGDLDKAKDFLNQSVSLSPDDAIAYFRLAEVYKSQDDLAKAQPLLLRTVDLIVEEKKTQGEIIHREEYKLAAIWLGGIYMNQQLFEKSLQCFEMVIALDPGVALAYQGRAINYAQLGRWDKVMEQITILRKLNQDNILEDLRKQLEPLRAQSQTAISTGAAAQKDAVT